MKQLTLYKKDGSWIIDNHNDPHIVKLFGTDQIVSAFRDFVPAYRVILAIKKANPDHQINIK